MITPGQVHAGTPPGSKVEQALKLLMEFIDLSRDLERNQDDSAARDAGKEIIYVLDENVFEIFFQPKLRRHLVRSFHSPRFSGTHHPDRHWQSIEAQLSLISSEYLLSGSLPGIKRPCVYMTRWHREELANRIDEVLGELHANAEGDMDQAVKELERKLNAMKAIEESGDNSWDWLESDDPWLKTDIEELRKSNAAEEASSSATEEALRRFGLTRIAADILASSEVHEPIDQLQRAVRPPLSSAYRSFHLDFPANEDERKAIRRDAHDWQRLLIQERNRTRGAVRTDGSLWFDAQSLALVRWAATKRVREDQRIVLVTGDGILFNAYRRWYVDKSVNDLEYGEDFLLRRIPQYSPMFNLSDSANDISNSRVRESNRRIFALINEIVEFSLLPFNLARLSSARSRDRDLSITRGREYLVMKMLDIKRLSDDPTLAFFTGNDSPLIQMLPQMHSILEELRSTERIAIGAFFPYISQRMNEGHRKLAEQITRAGVEGTAQILRAHLTNELDRLVAARLKGWLSVALESVADFAFESSARPRRIPLTIWSNAARFADLAVRASSDEVTKEIDPSSRLEADFLAVLARRFRLGSLAAHIPIRAAGRTEDSERADLAQRSIEASYKRFMMAKTRLGNLIMRCENKMLEAGGDRLDGEYQLILAMRGRSERASLCLFMAANLAASLETAHSGWAQRVALEVVNEAAADIESCWRDEQKVGPGHAKHLTYLQRQYVPNTAATEVIRFLLTSQRPADALRHPDRVSRIEAFLERDLARHPLLRAELSLFLILAGDGSARNRTILTEAVRNEAQAPLALDRWLLVRIGQSARPVMMAPSG